MKISGYAAFSPGELKEAGFVLQGVLRRGNQKDGVPFSVYEDSFYGGIEKAEQEGKEVVVVEHHLGKYFWCRKKEGFMTSDKLSVLGNL